MSSSQQTTDERNYVVRANVKRSILKQTTKNDHKVPDLDHSLNLTSQKLLDADSQDNTNTRLNRRVSFAPDVTLHSFNFVGKEKSDVEDESMDLTEPMAIGTTISNTGNSNNNNFKSNIVVSSQDVTSEDMEMTERQEKLSPILLPFDNDNNEDEKESTMELTETNVGGKAKKDESSQLPASNSHSITESSNDFRDLQTVKALSSQDNTEDDMELTEIGLFGPNKTKEHETLPAAVSEEEDIEITELQVTEQKAHDNGTQISENNDAITKIRSTEEQSMDLTQVQRDKVATVLNTELYPDEAELSLTEIQRSNNRNTVTNVASTFGNNLTGPVAVDEQMELTQARHRSIENSVPNAKTLFNEEALQEEMEETTHLTQVNVREGTLQQTSQLDNTLRKVPQDKSDISSENLMSAAVALEMISKTATDTNFRGQMELTNIEPTKSSLDVNEMELTEMQSVKRALNDDEQMYKTPEKKLKAVHPESSDMDLTQAERMSPIGIEQFSNGYDGQQEKSDIYDGTDFPQQIQSSTDEGSQENNTISLNKFIGDVGFIADQFILQTQPPKVKIPMIEMSHERRNKVFNIYNCFYGELPFLQMNAFSCMEILKTNDETKRSFKDLQKQINSSLSPPLLLREYFSSKNDIRVAMIEQLKLVKSYSTLMARKSLYKWQLSHFDNIGKVLAENLAVLKGINQDLVGKYDELQEISNQVLAIKKLIKSEIHSLQNKSKTSTVSPSVETKIRLQILQRFLESKNLKSSELSELVKQRKKIESDIEMLKAKLTSGEAKLKSFSQVDGNAYDQIEFYQNVTGLKVQRIEGSKITIQLSTIMEVVLTIDVTESCEQFLKRIQESLSDNGLFKILVQDTLNNNYNSAVIIRTILPHLLNEILKLMPVLDSFYILTLLFVTRVTKENVIEFEYYQFENNTSVTFAMDLLNLRNWVDGKHAKVTAHVRSASNISESFLQEQLMTKCRTLLPEWSEIKVSIVEKKIFNKQEKTIL